MLARDIKGPLATVITILEYLRGQVDDAARVRRIERMLEQLLVVERLDDPTFLVAREPTDVCSFVHSAVCDLQSVAAARGVRLVVERAKRSVLADIDPNVIGRALDNLVDNAIRYSPRGEHVTVDVRAREGAAVVEVSDRGQGVPDHLRETIFDPRYSVEAARRAQLTGGLGLAIASPRARTAVTWCWRRATPPSVCRCR